LRAHSSRPLNLTGKARATPSYKTAMHFLVTTQSIFTAAAAFIAGMRAVCVAVLRALGQKSHMASATGMNFTFCVIDPGDTTG